MTGKPGIPQFCITLGTFSRKFIMTSNARLQCINGSMQRRSTHVGSVDRGGPPEGETTIRNLVETGSLCICQFLVLHWLFKATSLLPEGGEKHVVTSYPPRHCTGPARFSTPTYPIKQFPNLGVISKPYTNSMSLNLRSPLYETFNYIVYTCENILILLGVTITHCSYSAVTTSYICLKSAPLWSVLRKFFSENYIDVQH